MPEALAWLLPVFAGLIAWSTTLMVCRRAERLRLIEVPNARSSHVAPTPSGGGIGIVLAALPAGLWLCRDCADGYAWVHALALLIAAVGLWDDLRPISKRLRFATQIIACVALAVMLAPIPDLPLAIPILAILGVLAGVWWINLFNFMDGIDGIAASQAVFMLVGAALAGIIFHPASIDAPSLLWLLTLAAACMGFLWHNWAPARIFMGDIGSTYLGFMILSLALITVREGWLSYPFWLVLGALFISDATVTLLRRMASGQNWLEAHRSHAYQRLARQLGSHAKTTSLAIAVNCLWLAPLAFITLAWPAWSRIALVAAYLPIVVGVIALGAGRPEAPQGAAP
jgi:Fuc2NAc and GlcNAc transferase